MGTSRGSSRSRLVVDETVWASEAAGEEAVLAEFADEAALSQTTSVHNHPPTLELAKPRSRGGLRVLSPHTPMKEVLRTVLVGCLSAMALGASFAIGFGYIWSDLTVVAPATETESTARVPPARTEPLPSASSASSMAPAASAPATAPPTEIAPSLTPAGSDSKATVPAPEPQRGTVADSPAAPAVTDPGPAFGVPIERAAPPAAPVAETRTPPAAVWTDEAILASQPLLSAGNSAVAESVAPLSPPRTATPIPARAVETSESTVSALQRSDVDAVRVAILRYQTAYTQKDVGAMALVWPSVDVAGVAKAFENVDKQALTLNDCRVTTAGKLATAVCPGQVRYVGRVGPRQMQERHGTWTIALERNGEAWQFTRLNVR